MTSYNHTKRFKKQSLITRIINDIRVSKLRRNHFFECGDNLRILGATPYLKAPSTAAGMVRIGNNVVLNSDSKNSNTNVTTRVKFVLGYEGNIEIGDNCDLNGVCIVSYKSVKNGSFCQFASSTMISDTDFHPVDSKERHRQMSGEPFSFDSVKKKEIIIGDNSWIGWGCIILKGAHIGNNCIVAAGSVVLGKDYPDNSIIAGNPAKVVKINE